MKNVNVKNLTLADYVSMIWPILEYCTTQIIDSKNKKVNITKYNQHQWYLYRQAFYGFENFLNLKRYYSAKAQQIFVLLLNSENEKKIDQLTLDQISWEKQPIFDPGRKFLIIEHMYTGTMFRNDVWEYYTGNKSKFNVEGICELIKKNYNICWVEKAFHPSLKNNGKPENSRIHKTKREGDIFDYYEKMGIEIVNRF
jgi:hypothetical protein